MGAEITDAGGDKTRQDHAERERNKSHLPRYTLELFREKIAVIDVGEDAQDKINLWWRQAAEVQEWIERFQQATKLLTPATPEKQDANAALKGCPELFGEINNKLKALVSRKTGYSVRTLWVDPILRQLGRQLPEITQAEEIVATIQSFDKKYWTRDNDQVIAICEAINERGVGDLEQIRMLVAQWSFQEFIESIPRQNLHHLFKDLADQTLVDDLELEKMELQTALAGHPWSSEKREKFRRLHHRLRHAMDDLNAEEQVKRDFDEAFKYATGDLGKSVSAIDILRNAEAAWDGFKRDSTLQAFWRHEQNKLTGES
ncbi:TPA: hypothetical protein DIU27_03385 [Candidatus Collierbacteria bacterium]|uniref:Uncharacterized protein n=1 Tax=Candidatus Collierbacteria bacterium GW2011_GWB2_44_22 TaxID=1618387 RepID=A0A0G1I096_9BACT|nr:MAG: hypothetical protein UW44_C0003G0076 [Candidatus Collierbacteria bacterium GW2011_GWB2_44_22]KKT62403.1 MAG: hypothetical protein UW56_C0007G0011 [Candidatus Collierbacteria bacterium GW2011_GWD1_44_27]KKT66825.1 MAG: hypothetical protein UW58_C0002G0010 [Candidatus Collierbacteria bacterium GW2011_GWC2_44_30]KKT69089.1 MAG: hypothetical protein UW64_C0004G0011 [Microgenomates group bacterium GW2011_GWC1_44_37]KKT89260.1 MAG: hypothetical protein UW88_C0004G0041 [Candidatus Collierbacte